MKSTSPISSVELLQDRIDATIRRVGRLEPTEHDYNSFVPYAPSTSRPFVRLGDRELLMMSGYSYLGLNGDPRVITAAKEAAETYGTGAHGVRALAGTMPIHRELEQQIAAWGNRENALVFTSGYAVNMGVIGALTGEGDTILLDKYAHASLVDGAKLSGANTVRFRHNDPVHLDARLSSTPAGGIRLVIVDSVYSMAGDIAPLPELREVCDQHGALLMVDEAHALGVIGETGKGIEEHFGNSVRADIKVGTLSKGIPSVGGWVMGSEELVYHLRYAARPFLFSAALPAAQVGAALESLRILESEPWRVKHIQTESTRFRTIMTESGLRTGDSETAVVPLIIGSDAEAYAFATLCRDLGVVGLPVVTPAVPTNLARLRIAITAMHTQDDINAAAEVFTTAARRQGIVEDL